MSASLSAMFLLLASRWLPAASDSVPPIDEVSDPFASAPAIAIASDDATLLAWEERDGPTGRGRGIFFRRREAGDAGAWSETPVRLDDGPFGVRALEPRLALAGSHVILAWQDDRSGKDEVYVRVSPDGGFSWPSFATHLGEEPAGTSLSSMISIAGDETGLVAAAWESARDGTRDIHFRRSRDFGASWSGAPVRLDADGAQGNGASYHPRVVLGENGVVLAMWWDEMDGLADLIVRRSTDGGAVWGSPVRLDSGERGLAASRDAALDARGNRIAVAWEDESGGPERDVLARASKDGGMGWSEIVRFSRPKWAREAQDPRVTLAAGTRAHVVWVAEPGSDPPPGSGPSRNAKKPSFRPDLSAALLHAAIDLDSSGVVKTSIDPTSVPAASPRSRLAWIGGDESITWVAWNGTRVDAGGIDAAWTVDGGLKWRTVGLAGAQNPEGTFVPVSGLTGAVDSRGALHLVWVQGRADRERVRFVRIRNPVAPGSLRE